MKALDVTDLHSGIEEIQAKIEVHIEQLSKIEKSVTAIVGLSDSLKGEGGTAIRGFFQEGHIPLLAFLKLSLTQYNKVLSQMKASLQALEPAANGRILESFLEGDLEQSLRQVELVTANLTSQTNAVMNKVSDIVALPPLRDDEVKHYVQKAKREKDQTIEHLHQFDYEQVSSLESVEADVNLLERYVQELQAMFQGKGSNVSTHLTNQLTYNSFYLMLNSKLAGKQTQNTQLFKQMYSPAYAINTTMTQAVTFDKWTNPSCPRPDHVNKAVAGEPERNWFQEAGDQIVSGAKTVGKAAKDHSREIGSTVLDFTPIAGNIKAGVEAKSGVDPITKRELEDWEKYFAAAGILTGGLSKLGSKAVKGVKGVDRKGIDNVKLSPSNYPNPDPPMTIPPVRYEPKTIEEVIRMRQGKGPTTKMLHGDKNIEAHHRQQVPVKNGGILDELEQRTHRGGGNHTRHDKPSQLTPSQRAKEIREHYKERGKEYILPGEGI
ncbi:T7SS effector LXG polymorphic toxin [Alkalihalophilus pseudofirmus]|uniref:T7SS effector LXG polymorphic toxin n=1 Tax=Alkalihalophilus pseudofirmus TaxID=79885 RepID=UPI00259BA774|nr:T7SS effector LXG polymorphic toxin [Alkalihalophilus pseudofirmus]WEG16694.1 T7SS effector LXG polymorphic toxin [Alkalihalophilus pseudofirmus]